MPAVMDSEYDHGNEQQPPAQELEHEVLFFGLPAL